LVQKEKKRKEIKLSKKKGENIRERSSPDHYNRKVKEAGKFELGHTIKNHLCLRYRESPGGGGKAA